MTHPAWLTTGAVALVGVMLLAAIVLTLIRLVRGPSLPDRVVAFDLLALLAIGVLALAAWRLGVEAVLDAALILALLAFVATVAFSRFVMERGPGGGEG